VFREIPPSLARKASPRRIGQRFEKRIVSFVSFVAPF
jgi:hypothetical protein